MAVFNPQPQLGSSPQPNMPDYTGVSRGRSPDRSFETMFSAVGEGVASAVKLGDTVVQETIEADARSAYDGLNDELQVSAGVVPGEITRSQQGLQKLTVAHQQGKITPEYYYQRLASTLKGLRTKYPGYERQVDEIVTRVTGERPANAFRNQLLANLTRAENAAAAASNKEETFVRNNAKWLNPDEIDNPDKYGGTSGLSQNIMKRQAAVHSWEVDKKRAERDQTQSGEVLSTGLTRLGNAAMSDLSGVLGVQGGDWSAALTKIRTGGGLTPEEQGGLLAGIDGLHQNTLQKAREMVADPAFAGHSPQQKQQMIEAALKPIKDVREMVAGGDYAQASIALARTQAQENAALSRLYSTDPRFATASAISKMSPQAGRDFIDDLVVGTHGGYRKFSEKVAISDNVANTIIGGTTTSEVLTNIENTNMSQEDKNRQATLYTDHVFRSLSTLPLTPQELKSAVQSVYGAGAGADKVWGSVTADRKLGLYEKMFSPQITQKIMQSNDPELIKTYSDAAVDRFQSIPEWRRAAGDVMDVLPYAQHVDVQVNPQSGQLEVTVDTQGSENLGFFQRSTQQDYLQRLQGTAQQLNRGLQTLRPIMEGAGIDPVEGTRRILQSLSVNLEAERQEGFFGWLDRRLDQQTQTLQNQLTGTAQQFRETLERQATPPTPTAPAPMAPDNQPRSEAPEAPPTTFPEPAAVPGPQTQDTSGATSIGSLSAKYESGRAGVQTISTGRGDPGGVSYGKHQLASRTGTMGSFLRSPEGQQYSTLAGLRPGTEAFNAEYRRIAREDPEGFERAQQAFITRTHFEPVARHAEQRGLAVSNPGIREALYSMGVQHSGARRIVDRAVRALGDNATPEEQVRALYAARSAYVRGLKGMASGTKRSVLARYTREERDALALARQTAVASR